MKRIIFVDDEPRILQALSRILYKKRGQWQMVFAQSGKEALAYFEEAPFDIIVSDVRMPQMDGPMLLEAIHDRFPRTVRIILSGHTDVGTAMRSVSIAHQFLAKPCESTLIEAVIERVFSLQALLPNSGLQTVAGKVKAIPCRSSVYKTLKHLVTSEKLSIDEMAKVIMQDAFMTVKILQVVNSAFFSLPRRITNLDSAIACLGIDRLKIFLENGIFTPSDKDDSAEGVIGEYFCKSENKFIVDLLVRIGTKIIEETVLDRVTSLDAHQMEALGAYFLGICGLPGVIVDAPRMENSAAIV